MLQLHNLTFVIAILDQNPNKTLFLPYFTRTLKRPQNSSKIKADFYSSFQPKNLPSIKYAFSKDPKIPKS